MVDNQSNVAILDQIKVVVDGGLSGPKKLEGIIDILLGPEEVVDDVTLCGHLDNFASAHNMSLRGALRAIIYSTMCYPEGTSTWPDGTPNNTPSGEGLDDLSWMEM